MEIVDKVILLSVKIWIISSNIWSIYPTMIEVITRSNLQPKLYLWTLDQYIQLPAQHLLLDVLKAAQIQPVQN